MNYDDQLKAYRILAFKCVDKIRQIAAIKLDESIKKSWDENQFLNLSV